jgi:hypothetical protein
MILKKIKKGLFFSFSFFIFEFHFIFLILALKMVMVPKRIQNMYISLEIYKGAKYKGNMYEGIYMHIHSFINIHIYIFNDKNAKSLYISS